MIERLRLRVTRASAKAGATYLDRYGQTWELHGYAAPAICHRCGFLTTNWFQKAGKLTSAAYGAECVDLWARDRVKRAFHRPAEIGPGGRVTRCQRCKRPLEQPGAQARGIGHTCEGALPTDNQRELELDDERTVRAR
jgi:hypothetical protein